MIPDLMELGVLNVFQGIFVGLLLLGFATFGIRVILPKVKKVLCYLWKNVQKTSKDQEESTHDSVSFQKKKRQQQQSDYSEQAQTYKDEVLLPREEAKRRKKQEKITRFFGPVWKGKGQVLDERSEPEDGERTMQDAARHRKLKTQINKEVLAKAVAEKAKRENTKKTKIELSPEPEEDNSDAITLMLRTPIGDIKQRRFLSSNTVQDVLNFMTTLGFPADAYTFYTTYPKENIGKDREATLSSFGFRKQVTLNIDEIEDS